MSYEPKPIEDRPERRTAKRYMPVGLALAAGAILSVVAFTSVRSAERQRAEVDFERRTSNLMAFFQSDSVQQYTERQLRTLKEMSEVWGVSAYRDASHFADFSRFAFSSDWLKACAIWAPAVPGDKREEFVASVRQSGNPNFEIMQFSSGGDLIRGERRFEYYPITFVQTTQDNPLEPGRDLGADPYVRELLHTARDTGLSFVLGGSTVSGDQYGSMETIHVQPVYEGGSKYESAKDRREKFIGFVGLVTRTSIGGLEQIFPLAMGGLDLTMLELPRRPRQPAQAQEDIKEWTSGQVNALGLKLAGGGTIDIAGRAWQLTSRPRPEFIAAQITYQPWLAFGCVVVLTLLVSAYLGRSAGRSAKIEHLVALSTEELRKANQELEAEIQERRRAEEERRQSEEKYRTLLENIEDGFYEVDLKGNFTFFNSAMEKLLGRARHEMLGMNYREYMDESNVRQVFDCFNKIFRTGEAEKGFTWELVAKDGTQRTVDSSVSLVRDKDGAPIGFQGVARDITDRKKAESEKQRLELQLRHSQKMEAIGTLAGGVAHDFNNLLAGILGYASMLKSMGMPGDPVAKAAEVIEKAGQRASQLTQQLLGFARKGKMQNAPVDLHSTVQEVVALLSRTIDKNITIIQKLRAPMAAILGDPGQLQQVILNLAVNARDAMPNGGNLIFETDIMDLDGRTALRFDEMPAGRYLVLSVSDTGCGIPKELQERVFEPFFTTKEQGKGTGMGLAMVYGIVKNHGGTVTLYSEEQCGTRFQVYLPLSQEISPAAAASETAAPIMGSGRILVVDDEEVVRDMASDLLKALGYDVIAVSDGVEAVEYYKHHGDGIALAVIDMIMPRMGGRECFRELKKMNPDVKAILSTGYSRDGAAQEILDEGMLGFAQKPYRMRQLSEVVASAMSASSAAQASSRGDMSEVEGG